MQLRTAVSVLSGSILYSGLLHNKQPSLAWIDILEVNENKGVADVDSTMVCLENRCVAVPPSALASTMKTHTMGA